MKIEFETLEEVERVTKEAAGYCRRSSEQMGHSAWACTCGLCVAFRSLSKAGDEFERFRYAP